MSTQEPLWAELDRIDRATVRATAEQAIQQVEENADPDWKTLALEAVRVTCEQRAEFHVDDVWDVGQLPHTREDRALGPVMRQAARLGYCAKTDRVRPSVRSHLSGKPVWRSLLYRSAESEAA